MRCADVAVVVPVFERPGAVREALASVAAQSVAPARLVVVDDGSADDTANAVRSWLAQAALSFPAELSVQAHAGVSAARNRGLAEAGACEMVAFLDSDDRWPADFLERTAARLAAHPAALAVSVDQRLHAPRRRDARDVDPDELRSLAGLAADATGWLIRHDGGILSASVFRSAAVRDVGGFDPALDSGQDWKLALELSLRGAWLYAPGAAVEMGRPQPAEEHHLSFRHTDRHRRWATILEAFVAEHASEPRVPAAAVARTLALRWLRAARELATDGRIAEARDCLRRSRDWWRRDRAFLRAAATGLGVLALDVLGRFRRDERAAP